MSSAAFNSLLQYVIGILCLLTCLKLWKTGLERRYRGLFTFVVFYLFTSICVLFFADNSNSVAYIRYWEITQPMSWVLSVWVVLELYSLVLEPYSGLATFGRWVQYAGFTLSTLASLLAMMPQIRAGAGRANPVLIYYYAIERGVDCGMLVFLVFILAWLTQYPVPLSRNLVVHSFVYTALFFSNSIGLFAQVFFGFSLSQPVTAALTGVLGLCILAWLVLLTTRGEEARVTVPRFTREHEEQVLQQLDALNHALLKISRH
jgi:hypothetical protein